HRYFFDGLGDKALHHLGRGAEIGGGYLQRSTFDLRKLQHRNFLRGENAGEQDDQRHHERETRTFDEDVHYSGAPSSACVGAAPVSAAPAPISAPVNTKMP